MDNLLIKKTILIYFLNANFIQIICGLLEAVVGRTFQYFFTFEGDMQ
jgi:hypothetical protein